MRDAESLMEIERRQKDTLLSRRAELWEFAYWGFLKNGRGIVVADGSKTPYASSVPLSYRPGEPLLATSSEALDWVKSTADKVRNYNPETEFVLEYCSPAQRVSTYRVQGPPAPVQSARRSQILRAALRPS